MIPQTKTTRTSISDNFSDRICARYSLPRIGIPHESPSDQLVLVVYVGSLR